MVTEGKKTSSKATVGEIKLCDTVETKNSSKFKSLNLDHEN